MPSSIVDICNAALGKLGQDITIAAMTEATKHARAFNRCFARVRDYVLADYEWPFATKFVAMSPDAQEAIGWSYRYAYPADCLNALAVCTEQGARLAARSTGFGVPCDDRFVLPRADYAVVHGEQSTGIATDLEDAYLIYVARIEDVARFPPLFVEALACRLAIEVAPVIASEIGLKLGPALEQKYIAAKSKAAAHANNEASDTLEPVTPSVAARR